MQMDLQPFQLERALLTLTPSIGQLSPEDPVLGPVLGVATAVAMATAIEHGHRNSGFSH